MSYVKDAILLVREWDILNHEVGVYLQVATQHLCWHDLPHISVNDLVPGVGRARNHKTKVELELLNDLSAHRHDLLD